jgi:exonuclease SbcC
LIQEFKIAQEEQAELEDSLSAIEGMLKRLTAGKKQADQLVKMARDVRKSADESKAILLKHIFDKRLSAIWRELFQRLVPDERFTPAFGDPDLYRGRLIASTPAIANGREVFQHIAAVMSSGNLNTAALTLFLSLHLVEQPKIPMLLLDDPVQNMDDIHVLQLVALLRAVSRQQRRQIVIAVHDRYLFEYLQTELAPTQNEEALISIELLRDSITGEIRVQPETFEWQPDSVVLAS